MTQQQQQTKLGKGLSKVAPMQLKMKPSDFPGMDSVKYNPKLAPLVKNSKIANSKSLPKKIGDKPTVKSAVKTMKNRLPTYAQVQKSVQKAKGY